MMFRRLTVWMLAATSIVIPVGSSTASAAGSVSGRVFQDFNSNGSFDSTVAAGQAVDIGVAGVVVRAYNASSTRVGEATTAADGSYTLTITDDSADLRVEFEIPGTYPLSSFVSSFAGANSGTSIQFVRNGQTNVDYAISVPGEYCQNNPNLSISRLCSGTGSSVDAAATSWVTRFDGGPYTTAHGNSDAYNSWSDTQSATKAETGSIGGMAWDPSSGRIYQSAYIRRHAELYEVGGTPIPAALFVTTPAGTTAVAGTGGTTSFLVDLETLLSGDQFSNSNSSGPGYIPSNAARKLNRLLDGAGDGGADNEGVDSDIVSGEVGVFEEVGKTGIGDIEADGNGNLWVVSLYDKNLYQVTLPTSGVPTTMISLGDITNGVTCVNGDARPFSVKLWRGSLYLGVICDASGDYARATVATPNDANLSFVVRRLDLTTSQWSDFFGPHPLNASGNVRKGWADTAYSAATYNVWNPWTDDFDNANQSLYLTRPTPMLTEIEFDRDGSMILGFRDRNGDQQGTNGAETPAGGYTQFPTLASGDVYRVCRTGTGYAGSDYVFEGGAGCAQESTSTSFGVEYYFGDFWFDRSARGHGETSVGFTEQVPGFPNVIVNSYDPWDGSGNGDSFYSGGPRWMSNSTGAPAEYPNTGSGVMFFNWDGFGGNPNIIGGFLKTNGMSDIEALCDQAPVQIGNRVWIDTNKDGIQGADEKAVAGVTVRVYDSTGTTLLGTAVTDAKGEYYFASNVGEAAAGNGDNVGGGIAAGSSYVIRFDNPADYAVGGPLHGYSLTVNDATDAVTALDNLVDSDATTVSQFPQITTVRLQPGVNDHSYDAGFVLDSGASAASATVSVGNYVWRDLNGNGLQGRKDTGVKGAVLRIYNMDGTRVIDASGNLVKKQRTKADGKYLFTNLLPGKYIVRIKYPKGWYPTTRNRKNKRKNSSSYRAISRTLAAGESDLRLDFGMVRRTRLYLPSTR